MATESPAPDVSLAAPSTTPGAGTATRADWEKATAAVLRKSHLLAEDAPDHEVWAKLTKQTLEGIDIVALGTPETSAALPDPGLPGQAPFTRGATAVDEHHAWDIRGHFIDPDVALSTEQVLTDLENGVNSLWLRLGGDGIELDALPTLLEHVFLDLAPVVLDAPEAPVAAAQRFAALLKEKDVEVHPDSNLGADPIGNAVRGHGEASTAVVGTVAAIAAGLNCRAVVVDGTAVHDAGAGDVQELAYTLAAGVAYLRLLVAAGHDVETAAALLEFRYAATDEQFVTIAKFRAARRLWHRVAELSGVTGPGRAQHQHAVTSRPMMSKYDPYVNMLRTTVAAFAAGVGGAAALTVLPFDNALGLPEAFSRRIARNTSSLLIEEAHVAKVIDPAGGSHAVEKLTDDLARAAWDAFGAIEAAGGIAAVIADGTLAAQLAATAARRSDEVATRRRPLTGVTEFPQLHEQLPARRPFPPGAPAVTRYGADFEALRDEPASTPVFLATMGTIAAHTARAGFATNLLAAGGIDVVAAGATEGPDDVIAAYRKAGSPPVACLSGTDKAYAQWGMALVDALRAAGAEHLIMAGKQTLAVDDAVAVGVDALAFLRRTRAVLDTFELGAK